MSRKRCLDYSKQNIANHQTGFDGEHIAKDALKKRGYKDVEDTSHKSPFDVVTSRNAFEVKTFNRGTNRKYWQAGIDDDQRASKIAWSKRNRKKPGVICVVKNKGATVYIKEGVRKYRVPGRMKKIAHYDDWVGEIGRGRTERLYVPRVKAVEKLVGVKKGKKVPTKISDIPTGGASRYKDLGKVTIERDEAFLDWEKTSGVLNIERKLGAKYVKALDTYASEELPDIDEMYHTAINGYLRSGKKVGTAPVKTLIKDITTSIDKSSFPDDVVVYRGVNKKLGDKLRKLQVGGVVTDKGFASTSMSELVGRSFGDSVIKIYVRRGSKAMYISGADEAEVLIQRGSRFRFLKKKGKIIEMELL